MDSVNNIYRVVDTPPVRRYIKAVPSKVAGVRLDANGKEQVGFILQSDPDTFNYDKEVLEIYSEREDRAVKQLNRALFSNGYLIEYNVEAPPIDTSNMLTDEQIVEIASLRNINALEARIRELTSPFTLQRILIAANDIGRPAKTVAVIQKRLDEVKI